MRAALQIAKKARLAATNKECSLTELQRHRKTKRLCWTGIEKDNLRTPGRIT